MIFIIKPHGTQHRFFVPFQALNGTASGKQSKETSQERDATKSSKEATPAKEGTPSKSKEGTPAREGTPKSKDGTPAREGTPKTKSSSRGTTPAKEGTPAPETTRRSKEGTPAKESTPVKESSVEKVSASDKESTPARDKSVEKAKSPEKEVESKKSSKEGSPASGDAVNENGAVSSREPSAEKAESVIERKKDDPSEALIASEQDAAGE